MEISIDVWEGGAGGSGLMAARYATELEWIVRTIRSFE